MNIQVNSDNSLLQSTQSNVSQSSSASPVQSSAPLAYQLAKSVMYLNTGDTFTGQITGLDGNAVEILLADKSVIDAKLSRQMNLQVGQSMSFEVTSSASGKIQLTPLYANLAGDSQVARALNAAELPVNARTSEMVQSMMEEGMSIDSASLLGMAKMVNSYPSAAPSSIVQMTHFGIPLNRQTVEQYEVYRNNSHQIADTVSGLSEGFSRLAGESTGMNKAVLGIFTGNTDIAVSEQLKAALKADTVPETAAEDTAGTMDDTAPEVVQDGDEQALPGMEAKETLQQSGMSRVYRENIVTKDLTELFTPEERQELAGKLEELGVPQKLTSDIKNGSISTGQTLEYVKAAFDEFSKSGTDTEKFAADFKKLIASPVYEKLLKNEISGRLLMEPSDVADKESVREYYDTVIKETAKAAELLNSTGRADTTLAKGTAALHDNVDFMNNLNQMFTYIQLPLKLNEQASHGDLYVYTNKKRLAQKDGNVSALLHLDMEHLGTMDVHVAMNAAGNVKTHFIMQKEEMLDFIASHLPELDARLKQRGYNMTSDVALNKESKSVPEIMFSQGSNVKLVQHQSFDVKA